MGTFKYLIEHLFEELRSQNFEFRKLDGPFEGDLENEKAYFFDDQEDKHQYWHCELVINNHFKNSSSLILDPEPTYKDYIDGLCSSFLHELGDKIVKLDKDKGLSMLSDYFQVFTDLKKDYSTEKRTLKSGNTKIEYDICTPHFFYRQDKLYPEYRIGHISVLLDSFYKTRYRALERILEFIDLQKGICKLKLSDGKEIELTIQWTKSDTDLLELIISLYEAGAIQNASKDLTQKEAIQAFSDFFGKEMKDQYKKLNAARYRKKEDPGFIIKMQKALEAYYQSQNEKN